jgi:hypothetical protein
MDQNKLAKKIARSITAVEGGPPLEHRLLDKFIREYNTRKWEHAAMFRGRKKVGKRPTSEHKGFLRNFGDQLQKIAQEITDIQIKPDMLSVSFIGTAGRQDTYAFTPEPFTESVPGARPVKKKKYVSEIAEEIKQKLREMGMHSLGTRYGKAGEQFADKRDDARRIAIGKREFLLNQFEILIRDDYMLKRPQIHWAMRDSVLISKVDDKILKNAVMWAKKALPMKEIRERARQEYLAKKSRGEESPFVVLRG